MAVAGKMNKNQDLFEFVNGLNDGNCQLVSHDQHCAILFKGADVASWLQGQVTNDLSKLKINETISFCFCNATGQIEAICKGILLKDAFLLVTDRGAANAILDRVAKYVIVEDVQATVLDAKVYGIYSNNLQVQDSKFLEKYISLENQDKLNDHSMFFVSTTQMGMKGCYFILSRPVEPTIGNLFSSLTPSEFHAKCLAAHEPVFNLDTTPKTFPQELGSKFEQEHISYNKGCYLGQEVLHRIHSRGHTNKTWVVIQSDTPLEKGQPISDSSGRAIGTITHCVQSTEQHYLSGAYLKNSFISQFSGKNSTVKLSINNHMIQTNIIFDELTSAIKIEEVKVCL